MTNLEEKINEKIKAEHISPKPGWQFLLKQVVLWLGAILTLLSASFVSAAIIFNLTDTDWVLRRQLGWGIGHFIFMNLPYFWMVILLILVGIIYFSFRRTKRGYKFAVPVVLSVIVVTGLFIGYTLHSLGRQGEWLERSAAQHLPLYQNVTRHRQIVWQNPEKGLLAGEIISVYRPDNFELIDFKKQIWTVFSAGEVVMRVPVIIRTGERVRLIGRRVDESNFQVFEIRPLISGFHFMNIPNDGVRAFKIQTSY